MRRIRKGGTARMAVAAAVVVAGSVGMVASSSAKTAHAAAGTVDFYSSLPTVGSSSAQTIPAQNGIKLALKLAGNKAGSYTIKETPLNAATAAAGQWTAPQTTAD